MALRENLGLTMWEKVGIVRSARALQQGLMEIETIREELVSIGLPDGDRAFNLTWHDWLNLDNLLTVSGVIAAAALARENSRGAHYREDFTDTGDLKTSAYTRLKLDRYKIVKSLEPVEFSIVAPGESLIDDAAGAPAAASATRQSPV